MVGLAVVVADAAMLDTVIGLDVRGDDARWGWENTFFFAEGLFISVGGSKRSFNYFYRTPYAYGNMAVSSDLRAACTSSSPLPLAHHRTWRSTSCESTEFWHTYKRRLALFHIRSLALPTRRAQRHRERWLRTHNTSTPRTRDGCAELSRAHNT